MGIAPLVNSLGNPRITGLRGPDILQLIAIGFCVGVAFGMFLGIILMFATAMLLTFGGGPAS